MRVSTKHIPVILLLLAVGIIMMQRGVAYASEKSYDQLANLFSEELYRRGRAWHDSSPDSAMVCFSLIESRYNPKMSDKEKILCVEALINKWKINFYSYYDYASGYECLVKAREIADGVSLSLPNIDLQLGILYQVIGEQTGDQSSLNDSYSYYLGGMEDAIRLKDAKTIDVFAFNLVWQAWRLGKLDEIKPLWDKYVETRDLPRINNCDFVLDYKMLLYDGLNYLQCHNYQ